jgi:hypothetical protein
MDIAHIRHQRSACSVFGTAPDTIRVALFALHPHAVPLDVMTEVAIRTERKPL